MNEGLPFRSHRSKYFVVGLQMAGSARADGIHRPAPFVIQVDTKDLELVFEIRIDLALGVRQCSKDRGREGIVVLFAWNKRGRRKENLAGPCVHDRQVRSRLASSLSPQLN